MSARADRTGLPKFLLYVRVAAHVVWRFCRPSHLGWSPSRTVRFLRRALRLLLIFRHNKPVRTPQGWKLHLYLPAYPTRAFFRTVAGKLLRTPPGPSTVVYSMTKACRYHCPHCYQRQDGGTDVDEAQLCAVAKRLLDEGVTFFDIEGGEPFMRYERLLALVRALDDRAEVWVNTSGDGVTSERLRELLEAGAAGVMVSVHSPMAAQHDAFCGVEGAFETACACVRLARAAGLAVALNSVLSEAELENGSLDVLMELADTLGCHYVQLIHPKPAGAWLGREDGMQRGQDLLCRVRAAHLHYNGPHAVGIPSLAAQVFEEQACVLGCTAGGIDRFYVNANGELQPCEFLNISFGNLSTEPFAEVWARMRSAFPYPCADWLCCTQGGRINRALAAGGSGRTPLPWKATRQLIGSWDRGAPTPVYGKLGIYPVPDAANPTHQIRDGTDSP